MLVDRFGRRRLFMIAAVGMLVSFTIWTACSAVYAQTGNEGAGKAVLAMIFLFYGIAGFAWPGLTVAYCVEILPYKIRAKGLALNMAFVSIASVSRPRFLVSIVRGFMAQGLMTFPSDLEPIHQSDRP